MKQAIGIPTVTALSPSVILSNEDYVIMHKDVDGDLDWVDTVWFGYEDAHRELVSKASPAFELYRIDHGIGDTTSSDGLRLSDYIADCIRVDADGNVLDMDDDDPESVIVDLDGNVVSQNDYDQLVEEHNAAIAALRHVYALLDGEEYDSHEIYCMMRGYCDRAGLLEFS